MANKVTITTTNNKVTVTPKISNNINNFTETKTVEVTTGTVNKIQVTSQGAIGPQGPQGESGNVSITGNPENNQIALINNATQLKSTWRPQVSGYTLVTRPTYDANSFSSPAAQYNNKQFTADGYAAGTPSANSFLINDINFPVQLYNPFQVITANRYFDSVKSNRFHGRSKQIAVAVDSTKRNPDESLKYDGEFGEQPSIFNAGYESSIGLCDIDGSGSVHLDFRKFGYAGSNGITYPQGQIHVMFYSGRTAREVSGSLYYRETGENPGGVTQSISFEPYDAVSPSVPFGYNKWRATISSQNYLVGVKLHITASTTEQYEAVGRNPVAGDVRLTQVEYYGRRMTYNEAGDLSRIGGYVETLTLSEKGIYFKGEPATRNNRSTNLIAIEPTGQRTIKLQNADGTLAFLTDIPGVSDDGVTTITDLEVRNITASGNISASGDIFATSMSLGRVTNPLGQLHIADNGTEVGSNRFVVKIPDNSIQLGTKGSFFTDLKLTNNGGVELIDAGNTDKVSFRVNLNRLETNKIRSGNGINGLTYSALDFESSLFGITTVDPAFTFKTYTDAGSLNRSRLEMYNGDSGAVILQPSHSSGNVGIGTNSTPGEKLTVSGSISASNDIHAQNFIIPTTAGNPGKLAGSENPNNKFFQLEDGGGRAKLGVYRGFRIWTTEGGDTQKLDIGLNSVKVLNANFSVNSHITASGNISASGTVESDGLILSSPNGTRYKIVVDNDGNLSTTSA